MNKKFLQFVLIVAFVVAQFFTQQLHDLTHFLSQTECESEYVLGHAVQESPTYDSVDQHDHCKFLQLLSNQYQTPVVTGHTQPAIVSFKSENSVSVQIQSWISFSASRYHQARAPPVV